MSRPTCYNPGNIHDGENALVGCGGGGVYLFWQLGAARAILEHRDGLATQWTGVSAGAICATLILCGVDDSETMKVASLVQEKHGMYTRPAGLIGIWRDGLRDMLEQILPENAAELCNGSLTIQVTIWQGWKRRFSVQRISYFADRAFLIEAILASCHIPWAVDGSPFTRIRLQGERQPVLVCDGALGWWLPARRLFGLKKKDLKLANEHGRRANYHVTQLKDRAYRKKGPSIAAVLSHETMSALRQRGYEFTKNDLAKRKSSQLQFTASTKNDVREMREGVLLSKNCCDESP